MRSFIKKLVPEPARRLYGAIRKRVIITEFHICRIFPIRKKRVVLCNVWGFGDNTKWIAKALRRGDKSVEVIFVTDRSAVEHVPKGIKIVQTNTPKAVYYLATAHVWVDCNRKEPYIVKRSGQIYIQTWHGSVPLKKLEADYEGLSAEYMENARRDSKMTDLCLSNGEFMNDIYRKAFGYECDMMITGSARMDPLMRPNQARVLRTKKRIARLAGSSDLHIRTNDETTGMSEDLADPTRKSGTAKTTGMNNTDPGEAARNGYENFKIAVYAPTYRENGGQVEFPDLEAIRKKLEERFGGEFVIVARVHPLVRKKIKDYGSKVVDGSSFGDLYELLEASSVLITDYSNSLFEFAYAGKPVFLYATDAKEYEEVRGFYFDYAKLPYPHAASTQELCETIEDYSEFDHKNAQKEFFANIGVSEDGRASKRIADLILRKVYRS